MPTPLRVGFLLPAESKGLFKQGGQQSVPLAACVHLLYENKSKVPDLKSLSPPRLTSIATTCSIYCMITIQNQVTTWTSMLYISALTYLAWQQPHRGHTTGARIQTL